MADAHTEQIQIRTTCNCSLTQTNV